MAHVLVIGPGAIGALVAARLANGGHQVTVAARTAQSADAIAATGVRAHDMQRRTVAANVQVVSSPAQLSNQPNMAILSTKCGAAVQAFEAWKPFLPDSCPVIAMQNGLMGEILAPVVGSRLFMCTAAFPSSRGAPGEATQTGPGKFYVGAWPNRLADEEVASIAQVLATVMPTTATLDIEGVQWSKLLINSSITSLAALTGAGLGELLANRKGRDAVIDIFTEGYDVGTALGIKFPPMLGMDANRVADMRPNQSRWLRHLILRIVAIKYRRYKSSGGQSLERGEKTEVDYLNGAISTAGQKTGVSTPVNDALIACTHRVESGERAPGMDWLAQLP